MTNGRKRRVMMILLVLCLLLIAAIGWQIWRSLRGTFTVQYSTPIVQPQVSQLCPGDTLSYQVHVSIKTIPATGRVAENFCRAGLSGACSTSLPRTYWLPLLDYRELDAPIGKPIPVDPFFRPGDYEFWHALTDTDTNTTVGYRVPFTIKADCP